MQPYQRHYKKGDTMASALQFLRGLSEQELEDCKIAKYFPFSKHFPLHRCTRKRAKNATNIAVVHQDCLAAAADIALGTETMPAVLNMASAKNCGGGFERSRGSQEEYLFRNTTVVASLWPHRRTDDSRWIEGSTLLGRDAEAFYPMTEFGGIYSENVTVFSLNDTAIYEPFKCAVLSIAADNCSPRSASEAIVFDPVILHQKVRTCLYMAAAHNHTSIVLGALGCGVYQNPPEQVAKVFRALLTGDGEFAGVFDTVIFAILFSDVNLRAFERVFGPSLPSAAAALRPAPRGRAHEAAPADPNPEANLRNRGSEMKSDSEGADDAGLSLSVADGAVAAAAADRPANARPGAALSVSDPGLELELERLGARPADEFRQADGRRSRRSGRAADSEAVTVDDSDRTAAVSNLNLPDNHSSPGPVVSSLSVRDEFQQAADGRRSRPRRSNRSRATQTAREDDSEAAAAAAAVTVAAAPGAKRGPGAKSSPPGRGELVMGRPVTVAAAGGKDTDSECGLAYGDPGLGRCRKVNLKSRRARRAAADSEAITVDDSDLTAAVSNLNLPDNRSSPGPVVSSLPVRPGARGAAVRLRSESGDSDAAVTVVGRQVADSDDSSESDPSRVVCQCEDWVEVSLSPAGPGPGAGKITFPG